MKPLLEQPELNREAIRVLCRELGIANTVRFVAEMSPGRGNYTEVRRQLFAGKTVDEIADEIEAWKRAEATTAD
ncbi:MAG: hypothetical protein SH850_25560 [Planctomycetaceae bacterium]|nr:hypothetical protein [Planctomycetaceae bacterium]